MDLQTSFRNQCQNLRLLFSSASIPERVACLHVLRQTLADLEGEVHRQSVDSLVSIGLSDVQRVYGTLDSPVHDLSPLLPLMTSDASEFIEALAQCAEEVDAARNASPRLVYESAVEGRAVEDRANDLQPESLSPEKCSYENPPFLVDVEQVEQTDKAPVFDCNDRCRKCGEALPDAKAFMQHHEQRHSMVASPKLLICAECSFTTLHRQNMRRHKLRYHSAEQVPVFPCGDCSAVFRSKCSLKAHVEQHHSTTKPSHPCPQCPSKLHSRSALTRHLGAVHCNDRQFVCALCSCSFKLSAHLRRHERIKHGQ